MVHRLHNRNAGYSDDFTNTLAGNQAAIKATEGATALNLDNVIDENKIIQQRSEQEEIKKEPTIDPAFENISMENAAYLQNTENVLDNQDSEINENMDTFEVDSIELTTPELFSNDEKDNSFNQEINQEKEPLIFENSKSEKKIEAKEPEMFEEHNLEEDFEIPAFLRRQKN